MDLSERQAILDTAKYLINNDKPKKAILQLDKILEIYPHHILSLYHKGVVLLDNGDYIKAAKIFNKALKSNEIFESLNKGYELNRLNKFEIGLVNLYDDLKKNLSDVMGFYGDKSIFIVVKDINKFDSYYRKILDIDDPKINNIKGHILNYFKQYKEALKYFDNILAFEPYNLESLKGKANALNGLCKYNQALECFEKFLSISPNNIEILYKKVHCLLVLKKYDDNLLRLNESLEIDSENIDLLNDKGYILNYLQKYNMVISWCDDILIKNPQSILTLIYKAHALSKSNKISNSIDTCCDILKIDSKNTFAISEIKRLIPLLRQ